MDRPRLERLLAELRTELADTSELDEEGRRSLQELADELERLAGGQEVDGPPVPERARQALLRFGSKHPRLAALLTQVTDTLGKMGI